MSPTHITLLLYVALAMVLVLSLGTLRTIKVMKGERAPNAFSPSGDDMDAFGKRLTRAHANCYENLPIAGAILLYAIATQQTALTDGLAYIFLAARAGQATAHLISTSNMFVRVRFFFFVAQQIILFFWLFKLLHVF